MAAQTIIVVNHDETFLRLMRDILEDAGYEARTVTNSQGAHELIAREQPALVIQESWLEDKEAGWMLLQTLVLDRRVSQIPVIFISSDPADLARRAEALEGLGHVRTMTKPFTPETLLRVVASIVGPGRRTSTP